MAYEVEVSTEKRKIVTDSMNHMMNGRNWSEETMQFQVLRRKDDTCSAEICIRIVSTMASTARLWFRWSNFSCHIHPPPSWLWDMDPAYWLQEKDPDFQNHVLEETSLPLLPRAQDYWLGAKQGHLPIRPTGTSSGNGVEQKDWCARSKVKVTVRGFIIKIWLCLRYHL